MTGQQLVKHCPNSIHICRAANRGVISNGLFRRHITWRAQNFHCPRDGAFTLDQSRKAEIRQVRFTFLIEKNVSRFDIAMENSMFMCVMHYTRHLCD